MLVNTYVFHIYRWLSATLLQLYGVTNADTAALLLANYVFIDRGLAQDWRYLNFAQSHRDHKGSKIVPERHSDTKCDRPLQSMLHFGRLPLYHFLTKQLCRMSFLHLCLYLVTEMNMLCYKSLVHVSFFLAVGGEGCLWDSGVAISKSCSKSWSNASIFAVLICCQCTPGTCLRSFSFQNYVHLCYRYLHIYLSTLNV